MLDANIGLALLHIKDDPDNALTAFRDGLTNDPTNVAVYIGIDQSLSLLGHPAGERVEALGKYPRLADAPNPLMFELILNLAESGDLIAPQVFSTITSFPGKKAEPTFGRFG